jgi:predicted RNase H-like HicB family nuclease
MPTLSQKYPAHTEWSEEDEGYVATCAQFPGLTGVDKDEALAIGELREAIDMVIELMLEEGRTPPEVLSAAAFSGQFRLRLVKSQHAALARRAEEEGVSLNTLAQTYIACGLANDFATSRAAERLSALILASHEAALSRVQQEPAVTGGYPDIFTPRSRTTLDTLSVQ